MLALINSFDFGKESKPPIDALDQNMVRHCAIAAEWRQYLICEQFHWLPTQQS